MAYIKRLIIGAFLLLGISSAFAVTYEYYIDPALPDPLPFGACAKFVTAHQSDYHMQSPASVYIVEGAEYENRCKLLNSGNKNAYPDRPDLWYPTVLGIDRRVKPDDFCVASIGVKSTLDFIMGYSYKFSDTATSDFTSTGAKAPVGYAPPLPPASICDVGCLKMSDSAVTGCYSQQAGAQGLWMNTCSFSYTGTGQKCVAGDSSVQYSPPSNSGVPACDGTVGSVNGVTTCVPNSTNGTTGPATPASGPATPASGPATPASGAASGSSTGSTGGTATTPAGTASGAATPASGPASSPSTSKFGGTCAATSCDGDAIQCAIAQEQAKRNCALFDATSEESAAYAAAKAKAGTNVLSSNPNNSTVDLSKAFDTSDALAGGHCISDVTVTVMNRVVTLPFTKVCPYLQILGNILVAVSMLMAAGIMVRG